jgi:hypothetical protein
MPLSNAETFAGFSSVRLLGSGAVLAVALANDPDERLAPVNPSGWS